MRQLLAPAAFALVVLTAGLAAAEWPSDPLANLAIADRTGEQVVPHLATCPDNGTYVGWYDNASGNYDVYLQRLSAAGVEQWPHNGILVSHHTQDTSVTDWDLICDSDGNAVLVFSDIRSGNLDVQAYKIGPDGSFLWGPDGIPVSVLSDYEAAPRLCQASDGDIVVVWGRSPTSGYGKICMQRFSSTGVARYAAPLDIAGDTNETPGFALVVPAENGNVIVSWLRNIRSFSSPRHIRARKFAPDGTGVWASHVSVFDATAVPIGYFPTLLPDGAGGAVFGWHRSLSNSFNSCVQHLDSNGLEMFPHNGVVVCTTAGMHHLDPCFAYLASTGETFVAWNERNSNQSQWGIYAQKITSVGTRAWGDAAIVLQPVDLLYKILPRCMQIGDGFEVLWMDEPGTSGQDRLRAMRLDKDGVAVWPGSIVDVATFPSSKSRHPVTMDGDGVLKTVWEDNRNGTPDIYGQSVNANGSLGLGPVPVALQGFGARVQEAAVQLSWTVVGTEPGTCLVLRRELPDGTWAQVGDVLQTTPGTAHYSWTDAGVRPDTRYAYALQMESSSGSSRSAPVEVRTARLATALLGHFPSPFARETSVRFNLAATGPVRLAVYDTRGRQVRELCSGIQSAGVHAVPWNGTDAAGQPVTAGVYFTRLVAGGRTMTAKVLRVSD
jgi:hypothetical protein